MWLLFLNQGLSFKYSFLFTFYTFDIGVGDPLTFDRYLLNLSYYKLMRYDNVLLINGLQNRT